MTQNKPDLTKHILERMMPSPIDAEGLSFALKALAFSSEGVDLATSSVMEELERFALMAREYVKGADDRDHGALALAASRLCAVVMRDHNLAVALGAANSGSLEVEKRIEPRTITLLKEAVAEVNLGETKEIDLDTDHAREVQRRVKRATASVGTGPEMFTLGRLVERITKNGVEATRLTYHELQSLQGVSSPNTSMRFLYGPSVYEIVFHGEETPIEVTITQEGEVH